MIHRKTKTALTTLIFLLPLMAGCEMSDRADRISSELNAVSIPPPPADPEACVDCEEENRDDIDAYRTAEEESKSAKKPSMNTTEELPKEAKDEMSWGHTSDVASYLLGRQKSPDKKSEKKPSLVDKFFHP